MNRIHPIGAPPVEPATAATAVASERAGGDSNPQGDAGKGAAGRQPRAGGESRPVVAGPAAELAPSLRLLLQAMRRAQSVQAEGGPLAPSASLSSVLNQPGRALPLAEVSARLFDLGRLAQQASSATAAPAPPAALEAAPGSAPSVIEALALGQEVPLVRSLLKASAQAILRTLSGRSASAAQILTSLWRQSEALPGSEDRSLVRLRGAQPGLLGELAALWQASESKADLRPAFESWLRLLRRLRVGSEVVGEDAADVGSKPSQGLDPLVDALASERLTQAARVSQGQPWMLSIPWFDGRVWRDLWVEADPKAAGGQADERQSRFALGLSLDRLGAVRGDLWLGPKTLSLRLGFERPEALALARVAAVDLETRLSGGGSRIRLELDLDPERARAAAEGRSRNGSASRFGWRA